MNLQAGPDAPMLLHAAAATILVLHIAGGAVGIAAGWTTLLARKGERLHRAAGGVFFVAMLTMGAVAAGVSPLLPEAQWTNTTAAVFTLYLVATGWATVRRRAGEVGRFEVGAALVPLGIAAMGLALAVLYAGTDRAEGFATVYAFAVVAALAAACDLRMIRRGGVTGAARIARHLWRMCAGLFVATGSFFLGQQKFLPEAVRGGLLPALPVLAVLALLVFWLLRVRFGKAFRATAGEAPA